MKLNMKTLAVTSALVIGLGGAPLVYAHGTGGSQGSMMGQGMMGQGGMMQGGQGGQMGQGGMMNMMGQMSQMMETCNKLMQGAMEKRDQAPEAPPQQQE